MKECCIFATQHRGIEQLVARWAHNPKVAGSSPAPATNFQIKTTTKLLSGGFFI